MNTLYEDYLAHFNKNHDPRNGQFAKGSGGSSTKTQKKEEKLEKQEKKATLFSEAAKEAYGRSATALQYLNDDKRKVRRSAEAEALRMYEIGEHYKKRAERMLKKINKNGERMTIPSLDRHKQDIRQAFIERSIVGKVNMVFNPFMANAASTSYKLNKKQAVDIGKAYLAKYDYTP